MSRELRKSSATPGTVDTTLKFAGYETTSDFVKDLRKHLAGVVDASQKIPRDEMNYLVCSTFGEFSDRVTVGSGHITEMMKDLSAHWGVPAATWKHFEAPAKKSVIIDGIQETTKQLKERMDLTLDEVARLREEKALGKDRALSNQPPAGASQESKGSGSRAAIPRPQVTYGWVIDNSQQPFVPKLHTKPNALRSLEDSMQITEKFLSAPHPYQFELEVFQPDFPAFLMKEPQSALPFEQTALRYVDTVSSLDEALEELSRVSELAIDVEHHSYRTYLGITCMVQISSRTSDYIFDTIALRSHMHKLNDIFTNPAITKVFHGGSLDIQWLQRDFGVYVVNMFDTGQAARVLGLPKFSLSFLMHHYVGRIIDKTHQTSDWRIRPLPEDMIHYARSDTHDLLYIHDCIKNDLLKKDPSLKLLQQVYMSSKSLCLQRYEKTTPDVNDFAYIMWKYAKSFSEQQKYALKRIFEWRDQVARDADESIGYVLPTKACMDLAEALPRTADDLVKSVEFVPVVLKQKIHQIIHIMKEARGFTGVVPVPLSQYAQMEDAQQELAQRRIWKPITSYEFVEKLCLHTKYVERFSSSHPMELIYDFPNRCFSVKDPEKVRLEELWAHALTVPNHQENEGKSGSRNVVASKVVVSEPKELPMAPLLSQPKKKDKHLRDTDQAAMDVYAQSPARLTGVAEARSTPSENLLSVPVSDVRRGPDAVTVQPSPPLEVRSLRPAFDYQNADYSKFSEGKFEGTQKGKSRNTRNRGGGLRDPNKSFNKQRNMGGTFSSKTFTNKAFQKPQ